MSEQKQRLQKPHAVPTGVHSFRSENSTLVFASFGLSRCRKTLQQSTVDLRWCTAVDNAREQTPFSYNHACDISLMHCSDPFNVTMQLADSGIIPRMNPVRQAFGVASVSETTSLSPFCTYTEGSIACPTFKGVLDVSVLKLHRIVQG